MDPVKKQEMITRLQSWVLAKELNGIKQHTPAWLNEKISTIGGASLAKLQGIDRYGSLHSLISEKVGLTTFQSRIAPQWGNLFEDVIKRIVEHDHDCIVYGEDLYVTGPPDMPGLAYSPDGLCVLEVAGYDVVDNGDEITATEYKKLATVLLEFKCPYSRIPNGNIPANYMPQVKMGLDLLEIADEGLFIEGVFRRCSWEQLGLNEKYDKTLVARKSGKLPIAFGIIGFYANADAHVQIALKFADKWTEMMQLYQEEFTEPGIAPDYMSNDLGSASVNLFTQIMDFYDKQVVQIYYADIVYAADADHTGRLDASVGNLSAALQLCPPGTINLGFLPWKLFRIDYCRVCKQPGYMLQWMPKIKEVLGIVAQCNRENSSEAKARILTNYTNKSLGGFSDD